MSQVSTKPADWGAFLQSQGLQSGIRMNQADWALLMKKYQEFTTQSQANSQGLGLAQQMARMGMGPGRPVLNDQTGRYQTPMDPTSAAAVGLMQSPGSRASGIALALQRLDPQAQAQLANAQAQQQGQVLDNTAKGMGITQAGIMNPLTVQKARQDLTMGGLQITGQGLGNQLTQAQIDHLNNPAPDPYAGLKPAEFVAKMDETRSMAEAAGALDGLIKLTEEYSTSGLRLNPEARAQVEARIMQSIPVVQSILNRGGQNALGTEERQYAEEVLGNPLAFFTRSAVNASKLQAIRKRLARDLEFRKNTMPYAALPPATFVVPNEYGNIGTPVDPRSLEAQNPTWMSGFLK